MRSLKIEIFTQTVSAHTTDKFISSNFTDQNLLMSAKKQITSLSKLDFFTTKKQRIFQVKNDVESYFYSNIFDISLSQHRIGFVSKDSTKKTFAIKLFHFCDLKTQQRYILWKGVNVFKRQLGFLAESLRDFLKTFDKASKCLQIPLPKPKSEIGCWIHKIRKLSLLITMTRSLNNQRDKLVYISDFETTIFASFQSKSLDYAAINLILRKFSNLTIAKFNTSTGTEIRWQTNVK